MSNAPKKTRTRRTRTYDEFIDDGITAYDADTPAPPDQQHQHVNYNMQGPSLSISQSHYNTPASPKKQTHQTTGPQFYPIVWNTTVEDDNGDPQEDSPLPFDFMDPNFVFELADITDDPVRRKRGQGVSNSSCSSVSTLIFPCYRIIRSRCGFPKSTLISMNLCAWRDGVA